MDNKQAREVENIVLLATEAERLMDDIDTMMRRLFANGHDQAGANALLDDDFVDTKFDHLDAAKFYATINALSALKTAADGGGNIQALSAGAWGGVAK